MPEVAQSDPMANGSGPGPRPNPNAALGPLPIVVGVTGHRDLRTEDVPYLEAAVGRAFDRLRRECPNTPLLVLSALAAGADQLVARVAMNRGIRVVAPLPLEQLEYERDFSPDELAEFRRLLARAAGMLPDARSSYFVGYVPSSSGITENDRGNVHERSRRSMQYAQVGAYIARNCQILIALWDGNESRAVGGTAQVVAFKRKGRAPGFGPEPQVLDLPEYGPVWQIVTPRANARSHVSGGSAFALVERGPAPRRTVPSTERTTAGSFVGRLLASLRKRELDDAEVTAKIRERIDRFNRDALSAGFNADALATQSVLKAAETMAKRYQTWTLRALRALYVAGLVATTAFVIYAHVLPDATAFLFFDVAVSVGALCIFIAAEKRQLQNFHQDYRALAEGLRVQEQWHRANVRETVADHYLRQHRGELDWIRNAIRTCRLIDHRAEIDDEEDVAARLLCLREVCEAWIDGPEGQIAYFSKSSDTEEVKEAGFAAATWSAAMVSILATVVIAVVLIRFGVRDESGHESLGREPAIVFIALTAVLSGLVASYAQKRAHGIHVKRYRRMRTMFAQAGLMLRDILEKPSFDQNDDKAAQRIIRELGKEALLENAAWVMLHRERPLEFIQGG
jgi:hypothetical protein